MSLPSLAEEAGAWIVRHELRRRLARPPTTIEVAGWVPSAPITALAGRSFPVEERARRLRLLDALGWLPPPGALDDESDPGLPRSATLLDRMAVLARAIAITTDDPSVACLGGALGVPVQGTRPEVDPDALDRDLDGLADVIDASWRWRPGPPAATYARLEALTVHDDVLFGRVRRRSPRELTRRGARAAGVVKRRYLG
jgi:hypothetical protein